MGIYKNVTETIGNTPLVFLNNLAEENGLSVRLVGKLEGRNPAGSVKDRIALAMIQAAEEGGLLSKESVIIEATSGNTGIGLAMICAARGYRCILTMPDSMSVERRALLRALGAELVLTEGGKGMRGALEKAEALVKEIPGAYSPRQFSNPANPAAHYKTTGPEIWEAAAGEIDIFVCGAGTGGTITGAGSFLKERKPSISVIAVEPAASPVLSKGFSGTHKIQGIGTGFVPEVLDISVYDEVIAVTDEDAFASMRQLAGTEGILAGISSGAALRAAIAAGKRAENAGKNIVIILPDTGERYLSDMAGG